MDLYRSIIAPLARPFGLGKLIGWSGQPVIYPFYHTVTPAQLPHVLHLYKPITVKQFERDLDAMLNYFEAQSLRDVLGRDNSGPGKRSYKRQMVLTFDDGLIECHRYVAPMLKRKGIPAVFFLNNRFIDNQGLFYRYKVSLLIQKIRNNKQSLKGVAEFLTIPQEQVETSLQLLRYKQVDLVDAVAEELGLDFGAYLKETPVYMSAAQVQELVAWGFEIGGHSMEHIDFQDMVEEDMIEQVRSSLDDIRHRFKVNSRYFSFPFTTAGVPGRVINSLLDGGIAEVLMGTAGLKRTGKPGFIQRIPMEDSGSSSLDTLKTEYLYYLLKQPLGRNRYKF